MNVTVMEVARLVSMAPSAISYEITRGKKIALFCYMFI